MAIDYNAGRNYINASSTLFCSMCAIFLLILLRPLKKISKEKIALFILFSKTIGNISYQFLKIYTCLSTTFPTIPSFFISPIACVLQVSIYVHIIGLALNRLHAVLFPFSYQRIWKERNIKYILVIMWLITLVWGGIVFVGFNILPITKGFFRFKLFRLSSAFIFISILTLGIVTAGDLPAFTSIFLATPSYVYVLAKFIHDYKNNKMESVDAKTRKDRIRILIVCLVSIIPCPWYIVVNKFRESSSNNTDNTFVIVTTSLYNTSLTILQCIEEICLLVISKDIRKLVKSQFVRNTQTNVIATPIFVSKSPHQTRMVKLNGQPNN